MEPRRHPWNDGFTWEPAPRQGGRITDEQARSWDEQGFFVLPDVLDADWLASAAAEIDPLEERTTDWLRKKGGTVAISDADAITFTTHLVTRSPTLRSMAVDAVFRDVCADLIGPSVRLYWDQAVYKKPESPKEFPWHQDNGYAFVEPQQYLTCWTPLVDATVDNGCPWVVPGLHRLGTLEHWWTPVGFQCIEDPADAVPVEARAGDIVVFSSLTPHRTGPNLTGGVRKAWILQYAPSDAVVLQGTPPDPPTERVAQTFDDRQPVVL